MLITKIITFDEKSIFPEDLDNYSNFIAWRDTDPDFNEDIYNLDGVMEQAMSLGDSKMTNLLGKYYEEGIPYFKVATAYEC